MEQNKNERIVSLKGNTSPITVKPVYQYDHGFTLRITEQETANEVQVHYSCEGGIKAESYLAEKIDEEYHVVIPDMFLAQPNNIIAYIYIEDEESGLTIRTVIIPVIERAKPNGINLSSPQFGGVNQLKNELDELIETTENLIEKTEALKENMQEDQRELSLEISYVGEGEETYRQLEEADLDDTLTKENKPADAAAVGEKLATVGLCLQAEDELLSIADNAVMPMVGMVTNIAPLQSGSGDPSPTNVRAISGWDNVVATRTGTNLAGTVVPLGITSESNIKCNSLYRSIEVQVKPNIFYTISRVSTSTNIRFRYCFTSKRASFVEDEFTPCFEMHAADTLTVVTVQAPAKAKYMYIYVDNKGAEVDLTQYTINVGQQAATYEPYDAQILTADLPETVYGGTLDWATGVMTVDRAKAIITKIESIYPSAGEGYTGGIIPNFSGLKFNSRANGLCDCLVPAGSPSGATSNCVTFGASSTHLYFVMESSIVGETVASFNSYLANNPITIVYPLENSYTIQLTPHQLLTLKKGVNNIWSNCGTTKLTYIADIKTYLDNRLAPIEEAVLSL